MPPETGKTADELAAEVRVLQDELGLAAAVCAMLCQEGNLDPTEMKFRAQNEVTGETRVHFVFDLMESWLEIGAKAYPERNRGEVAE